MPKYIQHQPRPSIEIRTETHPIEVTVGGLIGIPADTSRHFIPGPRTHTLIVDDIPIARLTEEQATQAVRLASDYQALRAWVEEWFEMPKMLVLRHEA